MGWTLVQSCFVAECLVNTLHSEKLTTASSLIAFKLSLTVTLGQKWRSVNRELFLRRSLRVLTSAGGKIIYVANATNRIVEISECHRSQ